MTVFPINSLRSELYKLNITLKSKLKVIPIILF